MFDEDMLMYDTQKEVDWRTSFGILSFNMLDLGAMKRCREKMLKQSIHLSLKGPGMN